MSFHLVIHCEAEGCLSTVDVGEVAGGTYWDPVSIGGERPPAGWVDDTWNLDDHPGWHYDDKGGIVCPAHGGLE